MWWLKNCRKFTMVLSGLIFWQKLSPPIVSMSMCPFWCPEPGWDVARDLLWPPCLAAGGRSSDAHPDVSYRAAPLSGGGAGGGRRWCDIGEKGNCYVSQGGPAWLKIQWEAVQVVVTQQQWWVQQVWGDTCIILNLVWCLLEVTNLTDDMCNLMAG